MTMLGTHLAIASVLLGTLSCRTPAPASNAVPRTGQVSSLAAVPNGSLRVAYQQKQDGELSESVHQVDLWCSDGVCSLTTLSLNQCLPYGEGQAFFPKVERTSTLEGNLRSAEVKPGVLVA